jgi:hypothetical protein
MPVQNEMERAELLQMFFLVCALRKIIRQYELNQRPAEIDQVLDRVRVFFEAVLVGSFAMPAAEREKLLPDSPGLYESVRAYNYARTIWEGNLRANETDKTEFVERVNSYLNGIQVLTQNRSWSSLEPREVAILTELSAFSRLLSRMLLGKLNSMTAEPLVLQSV